jgi:hypothetical protein
MELSSEARRERLKARIAAARLAPAPAANPADEAREAYEIARAEYQEALRHGLAPAIEDEPIEEFAIAGHRHKVPARA